MASNEQHVPIDELDDDRWWANNPALKRSREELFDDYPKGAKALKTLDDEGVLNGYAANFAANMNEAHYKNNGVANGIAEETANYMLHSNIEDRRRWCEKLVTGKTSICNVVKVIEAYRRAQAELTHLNEMDARPNVFYTKCRGYRVVASSNGFIK